MVRLTKIYTKAGDGGQTRLGDGTAVSKTCTRVEAYGTVDEANSALGAAVAALTSGEGTSAPEGVLSELRLVQHDLHDLGADLSTPIAPGEPPESALRIVPAQIQRLERLIEKHNAGLQPLGSFVLPGGTLASAHLHVARTVVRRAERKTAALLEAEPDGTNRLALVYLNRLSDLLFVLSRVCNDGGRLDVLWRPGTARSASP